MEFYYRQKFSLTEEEMKAESWESVRTNLFIMQLVGDKQALENKLREKDYGHH
jgi:hypothetical protein